MDSAQLRSYRQKTGSYKHKCENLIAPSWPKKSVLSLDFYVNFFETQWLKSQSSVIDRNFALALKLSQSD